FANQLPRRDFGVAAPERLSRPEGHLGDLYDRHHVRESIFTLAFSLRPVHGSDPQIERVVEIPELVRHLPTFQNHRICELEELCRYIGWRVDTAVGDCQIFDMVDELRELRRHRRLTDRTAKVFSASAPRWHSEGQSQTRAQYHLAHANAPFSPVCEDH